MPNISIPGANQRKERLVILSHNPLVAAMIPADIGLDGVGNAANLAVPLTLKSMAAERTWDKESGIAKLVIQIAHKCNLTCAYCISDAGRWGTSGTSLMSPDIAANAVDFFARNYGSIDTIYLFGGEPTLNLAAIEAVCVQAERRFADGTLRAMPSIGMTTNGTIVNSRFINLLKDRPYLKLSVSMDGPPIVHDHYRLDERGRPTYERIVRNVSQLRELTQRPTSLEITYSKIHQDTGMTIWETMQLLQQDTGIDVIGVEIAYNTSYTRESFDPLLSDLDRTIKEAADAITQSMLSIAKSKKPLYHYHVIAFTQNIFRQHSPNFCPAGRRYFAIAGDGAVYPCQNLPETPELRIGFLEDEGLLDLITQAPILNQIDQANKHANSTLGDQWFANFCKICPVYNLSETKSMVTNAPSRARLYEAMASAYLENLLMIAHDDGQYQQFLANVADETDSTLELNVF